MTLADPESVSPHLTRQLEGVLRFLLRDMLAAWLVVGRDALVADGNRSVVLCGAGGYVPEIDLGGVGDLPPAWGQIPFAPYIC